jgi:hypothetical protein
VDHRREIHVVVGCAQRNPASPAMLLPPLERTSHNGAAACSDRTSRSRASSTHGRTSRWRKRQTVPSRGRWRSRALGLVDLTGSKMTLPQSLLTRPLPPSARPLAPLLRGAADGRGRIPGRRPAQGGAPQVRSQAGKTKPPPLRRATGASRPRRGWGGLALLRPCGAYINPARLHAAVRESAVWGRGPGHYSPPAGAFSPEVHFRKDGQRSGC